MNWMRHAGLQDVTLIPEGNRRLFFISTQSEKNKKNGLSCTEGERGFDIPEGQEPFALTAPEAIGPMLDLGHGDSFRPGTPDWEALFHIQRSSLE
jgi:hypothetical protein